MSTEIELKTVALNAIQSRISQSKMLLQRLNIAPEVYERVCLNMLLRAPDLYRKCDPDTLQLAIMQCIEIGLMPDGDDAAIVPFKGTAKLMPMINGRRRLARQAIPGLWLHDMAVYADDQFEYEEGLCPVLRHKPHPQASRDDGSLIAAYALARVPGSESMEFTVMFRAEIDLRRAKSPSGNNPKAPWATNFAEMARKTAMGQVLKRLPKRPGDPEPPDVDGLLGEGVDPDDPYGDAEIIDVEPEPELPKAAKKAAKKATKKPAARPEPEPPQVEDAAIVEVEPLPEPPPKPDGPAF